MIDYHVEAKRLQQNILVENQVLRLSLVLLQQQLHLSLLNTSKLIKNRQGRCEGDHSSQQPLGSPLGGSPKLPRFLSRARRRAAS